MISSSSLFSLSMCFVYRYFPISFKTQPNIAKPDYSMITNHMWSLYFVEVEVIKNEATWKSLSFFHGKLFLTPK